MTTKKDGVAVDETRRPRVDKITGEFFRKGRCNECGRSCERTKSFTADSLEALNAKGDEWGKTPLRHKRCE